MTYLYTDMAGDTLEVVPARGGLRLVAADEADGHRTCIEIDDTCLDELVAAMYKALRAAPRRSRSSRPAPMTGHAS
ncbi:hypothetical protein BJF79_03940 [Actinomadura sp. CNU-125]|uniref:hypothetical protein n=1 Tax=Actinomadura sp. CNU-125 TaxID=1904961 RepID=UPI0009686588|nr:hypothetical protein [Actinomadura sp. CNU-125]OLT13058.1 hypothetical protein BJF79_03940 [Actinomadura sp. CNU-125]